MPTNVDWLQALLGGVGQAFTGYGVGQDRRAADAERARLASRQDRLDEGNAFTQRLTQRAALDESGFRPSAEMAVPRAMPNGMPGALGAVPVNAMVGTMRRGETIQTPQGEAFTLDRTQTPGALRERARSDAQREARAELDRRAQERREDMAFREKESKLNRENARSMLGTRLDATHRGDDGQSGPLDLLPPVERRMVIENRTQTGTIGQALEALNDYPQGVGLSRGMTPDMLRDRGSIFGFPNPVGDPQGVNVRSLIGNLASMEIKLRSGAAVTASEWPRLRPFIPILEGPHADDPETIRWKLNNMARVIEEETSAIGDAFGVDLTPYMSGATSMRRGSQPNPSNAPPAGAPITNGADLVRSMRGGRP